MLKQTPWLVEIVQAVKNFWGQATLTDIYNKIADSERIDHTSYTDWKAQIRKHIYLNSSDTDIFKGKPGDSTDISIQLMVRGRDIGV